MYLGYEWYNNTFSHVAKVDLCQRQRSEIVKAHQWMLDTNCFHFSSFLPRNKKCNFILGLGAIPYGYFKKVRSFLQQYFIEKKSIKSFSCVLCWIKFWLLTIMLMKTLFDEKKFYNYNYKEKNSKNLQITWGARGKFEFS